MDAPCRRDEPLVGVGSWVATLTAVSSRERLTYLFYTGDIRIRRIDRLRDFQAAEREPSCNFTHVNRPKRRAAP
jgi:hypothetical protein